MRFCRASAEEIAAVFQTLDTDGDGRVSQTEFLQGIRQLPELAEKLDIDKAVDVGSESRALFGQPSYEIDFDLDKTISVSEFASFFKQSCDTLPSRRLDRTCCRSENSCRCQPWSSRQKSGPLVAWP